MIVHTLNDAISPGKKSNMEPDDRRMSFSMPGIIETPPLATRKISKPMLAHRESIDYDRDDDIGYPASPRSPNGGSFASPSFGPMSPPNMQSPGSPSGFNFGEDPTFYSRNELDTEPFDEQIDPMHLESDEDDTGSDYPDENLLVASELPDDMTTFLTSPVPDGQRMNCCVVRKKKGFRGQTRYVMILEDEEVELMSARKRSGNKTSNYEICYNNTRLGKLRSNFVGTEFLIYDNGHNPQKTSSGVVRSELAYVVYGNNLFGSKGPRRMNLFIPEIENDVPEVWRPLAPEDGMVVCVKERRGESLIQMCNKKPEFNEATASYVLNFHGRVTVASVKNFQIVHAGEDGNNDGDEVLLQFGRIEKDVFTLDVKYPFSPLQAFGIALTSLDHKLACE